MLVDGADPKAQCGALQLGYHVTLVKDAHSSYSKQAAGLIEDWSQKLVAQNAELKSTRVITF